MADPLKQVDPTATVGGSPAGIAEDALLRRVRTGNAFEETVSRLLQTVRLGMVQPGEAIPPERDLAQRFEVSRDTVREAIKSLSDAGFFVTRRGRYGGTFVADVVPTMGLHGVLGGEGTPAHPDPDEIENILGLREILEVGAARSAASKSLSASSRELLWKTMSETSAADVSDYRRLDSRFHIAIAETTGVPSLVPLVADCRMHVNELLDRIPLLERNIVHSDEQHRAIVLAILTGDAHQAAEAMREHLEGSSALLRGFLA